MSGKVLKTQCCIAGGGPAGMMLGYLLARAGVEVMVLEKHADFLRDFRGDTVHPSTLEVMHELGILEEFLKLPHERAPTLTAYVAGEPVTVADFRRLNTRCGFIAFVPQWDFLDFLADRARAFPSFHLRMRTEVTGLFRDGERICGVHAESSEGPVEVRADLIVGADGRGSAVRRLAGLTVRDIGAPMDVLWMRFSRKPSDPDQTGGRFGGGRILAMIHRGDYWQCGYVITKGGFEQLKERGIEQLRADLSTIAPFLADRTQEIRSFDDVKLLTVKIDRLERWHGPGVLCIGDAAHAMSPVGGVGINLAIQDAVAAANILAEPLRGGTATAPTLGAVQKRREFPAEVTQWLQVQVQRRIIGRVLVSPRPATRLPFALRMLKRFPILAAIPARIVGIGVRAEHIRS